MEENKKSIRAVNLRAFRMTNELSQKEVAEYLEVSIAFISSIERGQAKLPLEKLAKLLDNDRDWETSCLLEQGGKGTRIHHDHRIISNNIEGEFNAPIHNNNYSGSGETFCIVDRKNYTARVPEILEALLKEKITSMSLADLVKNGFNPDYVTGHRKGLYRHEEFACFDIRYYRSSTKIFNVRRISSDGR